MECDFIIRGGMLVDPVNKLHGIMDVAVSGGVVAAIGEELTGSDKIIDAAGLYVMPGGIDPHVHCDSMLGGDVGFYMVAKTGITTIVDFAGPSHEISESMVLNKTFGLNVAVLETVRPDPVEGVNLKKPTVEAQLEHALSEGALGLKLLGGHFPLTPEASARAIEAANERRVMMAVHSGTTEHRSDLEGMRESIALADGRPFVLAHVNAYCRGKVKPFLQELQEAFTMLRDHQNVFADSHLAVMNATYGSCENGVPHDQITVNCLKMFGYPATEDGLLQAIRKGTASVMKRTVRECILLSGEEAASYWREQQTRTMVSFPANLSTTACACALERVRPGGDFLIPMAATDGGGIPRNNLIHRLLHLYHMGYLSLEDVVTKVSVNPARVFGFVSKGHLSVGADADITILDLERSAPVMSFAKGQMIMKNNMCVGTGGTMLVTEHGAAEMQRLRLPYDIVDLEQSSLYKYSSRCK